MTMRALVFDGPHQFHIDERPTPEPGNDEVRIRVGRVGICGSDLHGYTGESGRRVPGMVMGHEASGWIDTAGGAADLEPGALVTFNPAIACNGACGHTQTNRCSSLEVIGVTPHLQGAFADFVVVPADRIVPTPDLTPETAAMVEPLAVALQATDQASITDGDRVLVIGGGMIGQCVARAAQARGAREVIVSDPIEDRRSIASSAGFQAVEPEAVDSLAPFDRSVDCVGHSATASTAITSVPKGGTACFVGLGFPTIEVPLFGIVVAERTIVGSFCYTDDVFREAVSLLGLGTVEMADLIGDIVPFEQVAEAFEDLARGKRFDTKVLMETSNQGA